MTRINLQLAFSVIKITLFTKWISVHPYRIGVATPKIPRFEDTARLNLKIIVGIHQSICVLFDY